MERQSSSDMRTAFPRFPVITIGSCVNEASSIRRYNFDLASVADNVGMIPLDIFTIMYVLAYVLSSIFLAEQRVSPGPEAARLLVSAAGAPFVWTCQGRILNAE